VEASGALQLLVLEDANEPQFVLHGNVCCEREANDAVNSLEYLETRERRTNLEVRARNGRLVGSFKLRGRDYEFDFQPDGAYQERIDLRSLAGVYTRTIYPRPGSPLTLTLTIGSDGSLTGSHSNGCVFSGSVAIPNPARNMVSVDLELSDCGGFQSSSRWNGRYGGLGILLRNAVSPTDPSRREDIFYHSVVGPTWLGPLDVGR
jgi:hypothetical protein